MASSSFEEHLRNPIGRGPVPDRAVVGSAGGSACGDLVRIALCIEGDRVVEASFDAEGCGAMLAAGSACIGLVQERSPLSAARLDANRIATELGGLLPSKRHAAELTADALHRALATHWRGCVDQGQIAERVDGRVLVAMSGGVDSAVAAHLSKRDNDQVVAVTLKLWADQANDDERSCCSPGAVLGARSLAHSMGMPHITLDMESAFRSTVVDDFISEYAAGRTPNPCVRCNGSVRFDAMLGLADAIGAERLVTGHYARIEDDGDGPLLAPAGYERKDQAYMLSALDTEVLKRVSFPLSSLSKPEVRELARAANLPVAEKRESQDLCFLAGTDRASFMAMHGGVSDAEGEIVNLDGEVVGRHPGHANFTVGQRRGLNVFGPEPLYVLATSAERNRVLVGDRSELATRTVRLKPCVLYRDASRVARIRLRYQSQPVECRVGSTAQAGRHDELELELQQSVLGVAAGQNGCLYDAYGRVVGYGVLDPQPAPATAEALA